MSPRTRISSSERHLKTVAMRSGNRLVPATVPCVEQLTMRVLGITETCDLGSLYLRLLREGHEVRVAVSNPLASGTMVGLVPRTSDWRTDLGWIREVGDDGVIIFEAIGFGELQDELRA